MPATSPTWKMSKLKWRPIFHDVATGLFRSLCLPSYMLPSVKGLGTVVPPPPDQGCTMLGKGWGQEYVKMPQNFLHFECVFFFIRHWLGCFIPLTVFQGSYVILARFSFLKCFYKEQASYLPFCWCCSSKHVLIFFISFPFFLKLKLRYPMRTQLSLQSFKVVNIFSFTAHII